jgi:hypothetical protein
MYVYDFGSEKEGNPAATVPACADFGPTVPTCNNGTRRFYNPALQHRRNTFRTRGVSISAKQQYAELTTLRAAWLRPSAVSASYVPDGPRLLE